MRRVGVPALAVLAAACGALLLLAGGPDRRGAGPQAAAPQGPVLHASPATLRRVFDEARGGETILLGPGRYGTFTGGMKDEPVVLKAAPGALPAMAVAFNPARNITLDGIRITNLLIGGARSRNLTVRNSRFDGAQAVIRTAELANADIVFERNTHAGYDSCPSCYEGRVHLVGRGPEPSGVTIRDSEFGPGGNSDGIQNGGNAVQILDNRFIAIHQLDGPDGVHADAIQLYDSRNTVIRGNRMNEVTTGIMAPDGAHRELIERNVIETDGYPYAITIGADAGSVIRDNVLPAGECNYELPCGTLRIFAGNDGSGGHGTVVERNVLGALAVEDGAKLGRNAGNRIEG
jgi:hypothetical protein